MIRITESKLDKTVPDEEINIYGYEFVRLAWHRHRGGVMCYFQNNISFSIFLDIFLPKTKLILIGILYRPPDQSGLLDKLSMAISKTSCFDNYEVYILEDLNINLINNQKHTSNGIKRYQKLLARQS